MFPLLPLLGMAGIFGGAGTLAWYARLSKEEKANADRMAEDYATDLFDKAIWQLSRSESRHVSKLTRNDMENTAPGGSGRPAEVSP